MQRFAQIKTWERSHVFALAIYQESKVFPRHELFGITAQLRRGFAQFLNIAEVSIAEVEALLMICKDLGYLAPVPATQLLEEADAIARMTSVLRQAVESAERRTLRSIATSRP